MGFFKKFHYLFAITNKRVIFALSLIKKIRQMQYAKFTVRTEAGQACFIEETEKTIEATVSIKNEIYDQFYIVVKSRYESPLSILMQLVEAETGVNFNEH